MSDTYEAPARAEVANNFKSMFSGKIPEAMLDSAVAHLASEPKAMLGTTAYPANGSIASAVIWMRCQCTITGGKQFNGDSWGISFPGGGALIGAVYTDDINALYANTTNFALAATSAYTSFIFFDDNSHALGSFQAGAVSTVNGTGGGKGSWS